ncbi:hypothetical protein OPU71_17270 [Niveibacterium sp. 24ML]|uniref:hypothetical protein n=1 Tax=Niveibacterium sp. 24ML TaxID=2985512 RepID=UPI002270845D|nr:hypothetical protein [Niveibacterium sp. 24ML]MCX9157877.1 hypothetical protein [Niveibacterium sp. 24ML]
MDRMTFLWACTALALLGLEMFAGTIYLLAWAAGAGAGALVQWATGSWMLAAAVAAAVIAIGSMHAQRVRAARRAPMADLDLGGDVQLIRPLGGERWRVSYRGAEWDARLVSGAERAAKGAAGRVSGREANLLLIDIT